MTTRFFIITNDLPRAALEFSCHPGNLPGWLVVLDSLDDWMKIPRGSKCLTLWYGSAGDVEGWRNAWATRRERGGIEGVTADELDTIMAWAEKNRWAPSLALLYGSEATGEADFLSPSGGVAVGPPPLKSTPSVCPAAPVAAEPAMGEVKAAPSRSSIHQSQPQRRASKWT